MPKIINIEACRDLLQAGAFDDFIDAVETEYIEFKSEPYRLDHDLQKQELAKDVSGLANAGGGLILMGFKTGKDPMVLGDFVTGLRPVPSLLFRSEQYQSVIDDWIYPNPTVRFDWFPPGGDHGFGVIDVAAGDPARTPYLLKRFIAPEGKRVEIVVAYCERRRANVQSASLQELHALLRTGRSAHQLSAQYGAIQDTLQQLIDGQSRATEAKMAERYLQDQAAAFERDKRQALAAAEFEAVPNLLLAGYPTEPVQMRGLFDSSNSDLIRVLHNPPRLRGNGWDLQVDRPVENIHGRLRRAAIPGWKLLQLSREGVLLFLARGDNGFLSYFLTQHMDRPFLLNPFVLAHCVYVFTSFSKAVFEFAAPPPGKLIYVLQLRNMANSGKPALLHPNHGKLNTYPALDRYRPMPWESHGFEVTSPLEVSAGEVAFDLLSQIYVWFGFDRDRVPYSRSENGKLLIDEMSLFPGTSSN